MKLCVALLLTGLFACHREPQSSPAGLWIWHERWVSAPPEVVLDSGPEWSARGILLRFCPSGRFRMATGVFYRTPQFITLGSDDGLMIYEGSWSIEDGTTVVRYRLADAEIAFSGMEAAMKTVIAERPYFDAQRLVFAYRRAGDGRPFPLRFDRAETAPAKVPPRFVECSAR